jgi:hypothetical protein
MLLDYETLLEFSLLFPPPAREFFLDPNLLLDPDRVAALPPIR